MKKMLLAVLVARVATGVQAQGSESFVVQQATKAGVKKCLSTVKNVADAVLGGRPHSVHCEWATSNPDAGDIQLRS